MAMDIAGLVGVDSGSSQNHDNNNLSARSHTSLSSMEDILSDHSPLKKKSSTLHRLKKLKKQQSDLKDDLSSTVTGYSNDLKELQVVKENGSVTDVKERLLDTREGLETGQDARLKRSLNSISWSREQSQSPPIRPRRIQPQEGALDDKDKGQTQNRPSPVLRSTRVAPLDGTADFISNDVTDDMAKKDRRKEPRLSPIVKPRRFVNMAQNVEQDTLKINNIGRNVTEQIPKSSTLPLELQNARDQHLAKNIERSDVSDSARSILDQVSLAPPANYLKAAFNTDTIKTEDSIVPTMSSTEQAVLRHSSEECNKPNQLDAMTESHKQEIDGVSQNEDSDTDDLVIVPANEKTKTKVNGIANIANEARRTSADGESDPINETRSSNSSLTDVSKLMSSSNTATPTKVLKDTDCVHRKMSPQSSDEEVIVVNTFADRDQEITEETIVAATIAPAETPPKRISAKEFVSELNRLFCDDQPLGLYPDPAKDDTDNHGNKDNNEQTNDSNLETRDQPQPLDDERDACPAPLIDDQPSSDNSVAMSEPVFGSSSTSQLSDTSRSFMSMGALSSILTRTARARTFLSGGASTSGSLLSKEELERFFPDHKIKIFIATWNMCEIKVVPDNLEELLLPDDCVLVQDVYVIGTQESTSDSQEWEIRLQETLGPSHVLLHSATHGVLKLLIFIRRDLIWFCSVVENDTVSTRAFSAIKTKGAVAAAFTFFGTSFLFINSHFTAGDEQIKERIADYEKIIKELQLPSKVPPTRKYNNVNTDVTSRFDCIFWCGDFNFRLCENRAKVENWAGKLRDGRAEDYGILVQHDQLRKNMEKKSIFRGFHEGEIGFLPTYKYDIGGDIYDTSSKARVPSYTDRVLYKSRRAGQIHNVLYNACNSIRVSDHRAVYAMFETKIRRGKDDSLTSGGVFSRDVFNEANKRRAAKAAMSGTKTSQKASTVCSVM